MTGSARALLCVAAACAAAASESHPGSLSARTAAGSAPLPAIHLQIADSRAHPADSFLRSVADGSTVDGHQRTAADSPPSAGQTLDDLDPATAVSLDDLAACLKRVHLLADKPTFRALEQQTTHANGLLPGTRLKRARLTRTVISDVLLGRKFPGKAFLLTLVEACGVDLESDRRWEQAWDRLAPQYQQVPAPPEVEMLRQELTAAADWASDIANLIDNAIPDDCMLPQTWPVCAALLPLAQAILADESAGLARLADYAGWSGNFAAAQELQQRVFSARSRVLGPEHPDTLTAQRQFAYWTGQAGDAAAGRDQLAGLLPDLERILGPEHPDTLNARAYLAYSTGQAGDAAAARDQFAGLGADLEQALGPEHPHTLTAQRQFAYWTGQAGDAVAARVQLAGLLPDLERILGPEHPHTLNAQRQFAYWTGQAGILRDITVGEDETVAVEAHPAVFKGPSRFWDDPCSCGSGHEYKACHGATDYSRTQSEKPYATPLVQKLASEHGVDLANLVTGSGAGGRIRNQDVIAASDDLRRRQTST
jgi:e3 binding domain/Tetratricopeptide repeat/SEC-C motif